MIRTCCRGWLVLAAALPFFSSNAAQAQELVPAPEPSIMAPFGTPSPDFDPAPLPPYQQGMVAHQQGYLSKTQGAAGQSSLSVFEHEPDPQFAPRPRWFGWWRR